jgi:hypothetical protein
MKKTAAGLLLLWISTFSSALSLASEGPRAQDFPTLLRIRVDLRNLIDQDRQGGVELAQLLAPLTDSNQVWGRCAIQFSPQSFANVSASELRVPYHPQNEGDLSQIAAALNPSGYDGAIPFTIAGKWGFHDAGQGVWLHGLGWAFTDTSGNILRIGAMIGQERLVDPDVGNLIAHELGHTLSLPHSETRGNLMGRGTDMGAQLTFDQCAAARRFAEAHLRGFMVPEISLARANITR